MKLSTINLLSYMLSLVGNVASTDSVIVNYHTGYVDGVPLPGDLNSLQFTTETGQTVAAILELNVTAQSLTNTVIRLDDTSNPCFKW